MSTAATKTTRPSKEEVRALLERRRAESSPPPAPEAIREQLDWHLVPVVASDLA